MITVPPLVVNVSFAPAVGAPVKEFARKCL